MNNDIRQVLAATHKSHSYLDENVESSGLNEFIDLTIDLAAGIATCLDLVSSSEIARECGDVPAIRPHDSANLVRFAMAASQLLRDEAVRSAEYLNEYKQRKGSES
jgi:hypothetical protein